MNYNLIIEVEILLFLKFMFECIYTLEEIMIT